VDQYLTGEATATKNPTESEAGYQTQDLGTPYYQTGFTQATFDKKEWPVRDSGGQKQYRGEDVTYQFELQAPSNQTTALFLKGNNTITNSIVEVEAKFVEGDGDVGIVCRGDYPYSGSSSLIGYIAIFSKNGRITINLTGTGKPDLLTVNDAIKETGIYYRLRFDCIGQQLTVYENGVKIGEAQDNTFQVGSLGLSAVDAGKETFHVAFDNFKLWLLP
jgi:hypothetical protein